MKINKLLKYIGVLFLIYNTTVLMAQSTGNIVFKVFPPIGTSKVMIGDSTKIDASKIQDFPEGTYRIQIWALYYEYLDTTINIIPDSTILFSAKLNKSPEVFTYQKELSSYQKKVFLKQKLPNYLFYSSLIASAGLFATTINNGKANRLKERYDFLGPDPFLIETAKEEFNDQIQTVKRNRVISYLLLGTAISMKILSIRNKKEKNIDYFEPTYQSKKPDFISYDINWGMNGITLNLNF